jgi:hypothetical protein
VTEKQYTDIEKLQVLISHWLEHNESHGREYARWGEVAREAGHESAAEHIRLHCWQKRTGPWSRPSRLSAARGRATPTTITTERAESQLSFPPLPSKVRKASSGSSPLTPMMP